MCDAILLNDLGQQTTADRYSGTLWVETPRQMIECGLLAHAEINEIDEYHAAIGVGKVKLDACLCEVGRSAIERAMRQYGKPYRHRAGWWVEEELVQ